MSTHLGSAVQWPAGANYSPAYPGARVVSERSATYLAAPVVAGGSIPGRANPVVSYPARVASGGVTVLPSSTAYAQQVVSEPVAVQPVVAACGGGQATYVTAQPSVVAQPVYSAAGPAVAAPQVAYTAAQPAYAAQPLPQAVYTAAQQVHPVQVSSYVPAEAPVAAVVAPQGAPQPYAGPPQNYVMQTGSFVPAPAAPAYIAQPVPPQQPASLTAGMPDPTAIETQKAAYNRSLEEQAKHGEEMLRMQQKQQTDLIYQAAEAQKRQLMCQIDQQAKQQELQLSQQYSQQVMSLQQEFQTQKILLEKQANELALEYQRRKSQEEMMAQQYEMQKAHYEEQMRLLRELQQTQGIQPAPQTPQAAAVQQPGASPMAAHMPVQATGSFVPAPAGMAVGSYVPPAAPLPATASFVPPPPPPPPFPPTATVTQMQPRAAPHYVSTPSYIPATGSPSAHSLSVAETVVVQAPYAENASYVPPVTQYAAPPAVVMQPDYGAYGQGVSHYTAPPTQYTAPVTQYTAPPTQYAPSTAQYCGSASEVYAGYVHQEVPPTAVYQPRA